MAMRFEIREVEDLEGLLAIEEIQRQGWGFADKEIVPESVLVAIQRAGGLILGAILPGGEMGGFVFSPMVAADDPSFVAKESARPVGVFNRQSRRLFVDLQTHELPGSSGSLATFAGDHSDRLAHVADPILRQERLVLDDRAEQFVPAHVGVGVDAYNAGNLECRVAVDGEQATVGHGTRDEVDDELSRSAREVLHIGRGAGDMAVGRVVGWILWAAAEVVAFHDKRGKAPRLPAPVVEEA